jgi:hypothetical protein
MLEQLELEDIKAGDTLVGKTSGSEYSVVAVNKSRCVISLGDKFWVIDDCDLGNYRFPVKKFSEVRKVGLVPEKRSVNNRVYTVPKRNRDMFVVGLVEFFFEDDKLVDVKIVGKESE